LRSNYKVFCRCYAILLVLLIPIPGIAAGMPAQTGGGFEEQLRIYKSSLRSGAEAFSKENYSAVIANYTTAIELSPFETSSYYQRGTAFYRLGRYKECIADFSRIILLDDRMGTAYTYLGLCKAGAGEYKEALNAYNKALEINPKDVSVHNNIAILYASARNANFRDRLKALEYAIKASELSGEKNAEILDSLSYVYFVNGKIPEAIEAEKKALKLAPENEAFKKKLQDLETQLSGTKKP